MRLGERGLGIKGWVRVVAAPEGVEVHTRSHGIGVFAAGEVVVFGDVKERQ
jgi:hypothetical protein